jgi:hypothetical protein
MNLHTMPRVTGLFAAIENHPARIIWALGLSGFDFLAPYPTTEGEVFFARLVVPVRLLRYWLGM